MRGELFCALPLLILLGGNNRIEDGDGKGDGDGEEMEMEMEKERNVLYRMQDMYSCVIILADRQTLRHKGRSRNSLLE